MITSSQRVIELARKRRESFIAKRSLIEQDINRYREQLEKLSDDTKEKLNIDFTKLNAQTLFPSLYKEKYNAEEYAQERAAYAEIMKPIVILRKELLERAQALSNA